MNHKFLICWVSLVVDVNIDSLHVKVVLSNRFSPLVIFGGQEAIGEPQNSMFMFLLGCQHPQHQNQQNDDSRNSNQVQIYIGGFFCWSTCF